MEFTSEGKFLPQMGQKDTRSQSKYVQRTLLDYRRRAEGEQKEKLHIRKSHSLLA
jgi:hypothetical protein